MSKYLVFKDLLGIGGIAAGIRDPYSNNFTVEKKCYVIFKNSFISQL